MWHLNNFKYYRHMILNFIYVYNNLGLNVLMGLGKIGQCRIDMNFKLGAYHSSCSQSWIVRETWVGLTNGMQKRVDCGFCGSRTIEYLKLEGTHKDFWIQVLAQLGGSFLVLNTSSEIFQHEALSRNRSWKYKVSKAR